MLFKNILAAALTLAAVSATPAAYADTPIALGGTDVTGAHALSMHGHVLDASGFQDERVQLGSLTDRSNGHRMRVVKLRNGHMMALVPLAEMFKKKGPHR